MANYLSFPIANELVTFIEEDSPYEDAVKSFGATILPYYFNMMGGFGIASEVTRNESRPDFVILRIQRRFPGDRGVVDHALVEAKKATDPLEASLEQLENALEGAITEFGRCWAILLYSTQIMFYAFYQDEPANHRLIPWCPQSDPSRHTFHIRHDAATVHHTLQYLAQTNEPPAR